MRHFCASCVPSLSCGVQDSYVGPSFTVLSRRVGHNNGHNQGTIVSEVAFREPQPTENASLGRLAQLEEHSVYTRFRGLLAPFSCSMESAENAGLAWAT